MQGRLYWRIWLAILVTVVLFAVLAGVAWRIHEVTTQPPSLSEFAEMANRVLPADDRPVEEQQAALVEWSRRLEADLALYWDNGRRIAGTSDTLRRPGMRGEPPALPPPPRGAPGPFELEPPWSRPPRDWHEGAAPRVPREGADRLDDRSGNVGEVKGPPRGPVVALRLDDGRELLIRRSMRPPRLPPIVLFALIALAVGVGAYPVVRRLTRRLERLQQGVMQWGAGDLSARVGVEGSDEVAQLAASFNESAARIEQLVGAHRTLLANASHELRSPLTRIRMGIELLAAAPTTQRRDELARDIAELDQLIDEILLASRLEAGAAPTFEPVDLTGIVAQECAQVDVPLQADALIVHGNARLLQRLVRNLLENARRYGGGDVEAVLHATSTVVEFDVLDRGPGVSEAERERVFEPFYRAAAASEASGGVGLGLTLVRQIARQHGGDVRCVPRDGGGSIFRLTLPQAGAVPR